MKVYVQKKFLVIDFVDRLYLDFHINTNLCILVYGNPKYNLPTSWIYIKISFAPTPLIVVLVDDYFKKDVRALFNGVIFKRITKNTYINFYEHLVLERFI